MSTNRNGGSTFIKKVLALALIVPPLSAGTLLAHTAKALHPSAAGFRVVGNKILAPNGKQFVPYGIVLECAAASVTSINNKCDGKDQTGNTATAVVAAAAKDWHANIVRFQVA